MIRVRIKRDVRPYGGRIVPVIKYLRQDEVLVDVARYSIRNAKTLRTTATDPRIYRLTEVEPYTGKRDAV